MQKAASTPSNKIGEITVAFSVVLPSVTIIILALLPYYIRPQACIMAVVQFSSISNNLSSSVTIASNRSSSSI